MATYLTLVTMLLKYTEKITDINTASASQIEQALRDINDARRLVYNHDDFSYKTVIKRGFVYTVQTDLSLPSRGTPLPTDFLGFHQTGKVYLEAYPERRSLDYLPYHKIIDRTEGPLSTARGIPTDYGVGGPSDGSGSSQINQRELLLWPTPLTATMSLKLVYQSVGPPDIDDIGDADVEIPRIPATWHIPVILAVAKMLRKMDKGADDSAFKLAVTTAIGQMQVQEPHGREKATGRRPHRAWRN